MNHVLTVTNIEKRYGSVIVLRDISFAVDGGECVALVGSNGAGKSTLLNLCAGFVSANAGTVAIHTNARHETHSKAFLAVENPDFPVKHTTTEILGLAAALAGIPEASSRVEALLAYAGLGEFRETAASTLSSGNKQRLQLTVAKIVSPSVLLLDEPTAFLDPPGTMLLREMIGEFTRMGTAVLMSSHNIHEVVLASSRLLKLQHGQLQEVLLDANLATRDLEISLFPREKALQT